MKKKVFVLFILFLFTSSLHFISAQDKIITIQNDTIHCRILSVSPTYIQYEQTAENGFVTGKFIPTEQVFIGSVVYKTSSHLTPSQFNDFSRWLFYTGSILPIMD